MKLLCRPWRALPKQDLLAYDCGEQFPRQWKWFSVGKIGPHWKLEHFSRGYDYEILSVAQTCWGFYFMHKWNRCGMLWKIVTHEHVFGVCKIWNWYYVERVLGFQLNPKAWRECASFFTPFHFEHYLAYLESYKRLKMSEIGRMYSIIS